MPTVSLNTVVSYVLVRIRASSTRCLNLGGPNHYHIAVNRIVLWLPRTVGLLGKQLEFHRGSYNDPLPFADASFDGFYHVQALTYVKDLSALLTEVRLRWNVQHCASTWCAVLQHAAHRCNAVYGAAQCTRVLLKDGAYMLLAMLHPLSRPVRRCSI